MVWLVAWPIGELACLAATDAPERETRLLGAAAALCDEIRAGPAQANLRRVDAAVATARAALGGDAFAACWAAGRALPLGEIVAEAMRVSPAPRIAPSVRPHGLTPRGLDVLRLVAQHLTDREIAERLFVARRTASKHVAAILAKLGVASRAEAAARAVRDGLA
jgi:DNA-binding NarL/FixJ family response regulator